MKQILFALFVGGLFQCVHAEEPVVSSPVSDAPVAVNEQKADPATPVVQPAVPPAAEATQSLKDDVKTPEPKVSPAEATPAMASESAKSDGDVSLSSSTVPVATAPEAVKTPDSKAVDPTPPVGCVAPLQQIVAYHKKEMADLEQKIARWNATVGVTMKRQQELENELTAKLKKQEELIRQNTKAGKKEANALKKEISKIQKDLQSVNKERKTQCKNLSEEIKALSQESSQSLKAACQQAIADIQKSGN